MLLLALTIQSHRVLAQSVTITLMPGWNWISVPLMDTLDFETALGSFTPMSGDVIKSQWSNATYMSNGLWRGPISQFYPGYGYMYYSNRPMPVMVTFTTQQPTPQIIVTTMEPTDITTNSATCGGSVSSSNGDYVSVTLRGICWSTSPNPTFNDNYVEVGNGIGSFSTAMTDLTIGITYYVRAFVVTANGATYGDQKSFTTRDGVAVVTTAEMTEIGITTAICGGIVTDDGGLAVTARGVCWSTESNPTVANLHSTNGSGTGSFSSNLTGLMSNTIYYVRAYATNNLMTVYGGELSFITGNPTVDLGLPSGLLWATCNVGADNPEDYGDYFAWGGTQPKDTYDWSTYQYCHGSYNTLTKYCTNSSYGYIGFTDNLTTLLPEDDAATANWGDGWRMPTLAEWQELLNNTTVTWTTQNGVNGRLFTANNGNSLFLPAAGDRDGSSLYGAGSIGNYWSSSLYTGYPSIAWYFYFNSGNYGMNYNYGSRGSGRSVRPVRSSQN